MKKRYARKDTPVIKATGHTQLTTPNIERIGEVDENDAEEDVEVSEEEEEEEDASDDEINTTSLPEGVVYSGCHGKHLEIQDNQLLTPASETVDQELLVNRRSNDVIKTGTSSSVPRNSSEGIGGMLLAKDNREELKKIVMERVSDDGSLNSRDPGSILDLTSTVSSDAIGLNGSAESGRIEIRCHGNAAPSRKPKYFVRKDTPRAISTTKHGRGFTKLMQASAKESLSEEGEPMMVAAAKLEPSLTGSASPRQHYISKSKLQPETIHNNGTYDSGTNQLIQFYSDPDDVSSHPVEATAGSSRGGRQTTVRRPPPKPSRVLQRKNTPAILPKIEQLYADKKQPKEILCEEDESQIE